MTRLSVIVPIYNREKFLSRCLDSIISQSLSDMEIICVDDGSTDRSLDIIKKYAGWDKRIVIHCKPNGGVSSARNAGMQFASSQFITFMDPDDHLIDLSAYENMIKIAETDDSDIVFAYFHDCDENINALSNRFENFDSSLAQCLSEKARFIEFGYPWQKIYRAQLFESCQTKFPLNIVFEDNPVNLQLIIAANRISVYPKYIINYVHHGQSITMQKNLDAFNMFTVVSLMEEEMNKHGITDPKFVSSYVDYRLYLLACGYMSLPSSPVHKMRYIRLWNKLLTPRDRWRLRECPKRQFDQMYKYLATGNTGLFIFNESCRYFPRFISWSFRLAYSLVRLLKIRSCGRI